MNIAQAVLAALILACLVVAPVAQAKKISIKYKSLDEDLLCNVCEIVAEALSDGIESANPTQSFPAGSRTRADGSYESKRYARSESHVYELLEDMCARHVAGRTAVSTDNATGKRTLVNMNAGGTFSNVKIGGVTETSVMGACHLLVEQAEESLIAWLPSTKGRPATRQKLCVDWTRLCPSAPGAAEL